MVVKINTHGNPMPVQHGEWIDLATAEDVYLEPLEYKRISLGISMQVPVGYYPEVLPRSSTPEKFGIILANSMGIIEQTYCGDNDIWCFPAVAFRKTFIPKGTRIAQFRVVKKNEEVELLQVEILGNPDRGGFGSTGTK